MNSIYELPQIRALMLAEQGATDPDVKRAIHNEMLRQIKIEQVLRGQRSRMDYKLQKGDNK